MALSEKNRKLLDRLKENPSSEFGPAGLLRSLLAHGHPDAAEQHEIAVVLSKMGAM